MYMPIASRKGILLGIALAVVSWGAFLRAETYTIQELPPPNPAGNSYGNGINEAGIVVGQALTFSGYYRAVQWEDGSPINLGALPGDVGSLAFGISNDDRVVGRSSGVNVCATGFDPVLWEAGEMEALPDPAQLHAFPYKINDAGIAVGEAYDFCTLPWDNAAYKWEFVGGSWTVSLLPPLAGDPESGSYDVDATGVAVGWSGDSSGGGEGHFRACRWEIGVPAALSDLGGDHSMAFGINELGQFAGYSQTPEGTFRAYFFDGATAIDLGTLPGYEHSAANRLNNAGTIIGHAFNSTDDATLLWPYGEPLDDARAFVWRDGVLHDVNDLIPAGSGWTSVDSLYDINESGQITGSGRRNNMWRACLLTPCFADANGDWTVDPLDAGYVLARFGCPVGTGDADCDAADANGDGMVDPLDVGYVLARFGACA